MKTASATIPATIHIVDDDASFRKAISRLLGVNGYHTVEHSSAEDFLAAAPTGRLCVLLDVRMPGLSGLQAQEVLSSLEGDVPIIFVTGHGDIPMSVRAIKAGAEDFLTKPIPGDRLLGAIEAALTRYDAAYQKRAQLRNLRERFKLLTAREVQVFNLVVAGKLNREIANELGTTERTIKAHRHQAMEKMGAESLAELVTMAQRLQDEK